MVRVLVLSGLMAAVAMACAGGLGDVRAETPTKPATVATQGVQISDTEGAFVINESARALVTPSVECGEKPVTSNFGQYIGNGVRGVRVTYPGLAEPLYGLLALCIFPGDYQGPASRSYRIEIPKEFVDATEGGRVSVVYEPYTYENADATAWALWLARDASAFPGVSFAAAAPQPAQPAQPPAQDTGSK